MRANVLPVQPVSTRAVALRLLRPSDGTLSVNLRGHADILRQSGCSDKRRHVYIALAKQLWKQITFSLIAYVQIARVFEHFASKLDGETTQKNIERLCGAIGR